MLCARIGEKRVLATKLDREEGRRLSQEGALICACCETPVTFKAGARKIEHFAHRPGSGCPMEQDPDYRPESELHLRTKLALLEWVTRVVPGAEADVEVPIPETGQRADLLLTAGGKRIALEVQCSPLSGEDWRARHEGYASAGIADVWILTGQAPRFTMIPGSERFGLPPSYRFLLKDLAATVLHDTGELHLAWMAPSREPFFSSLRPDAEGLQLAVVNALAAHHSREGAAPWSERHFRDTAVVNGTYVAAAPLDACALALDPAGILFGPRHAALRAEGHARDLAVRAGAR